MKRVSLALVLLLCSFGVFKVEAAIASMKDAQSLMLDCSKNMSDINFISCSYYVMGVMDSLMLTLNASGVDTICYSDKALVKITPHYIAKIYVNYLLHNPKELNVAPPAVIDQVILTNFPIPKECYVK